MKKLSILLASLILFAGITYAAPVMKQEKAKTEKKADKKADNKEVKKVPSKKKDDKKAPK